MLIAPMVFEKWKEINFLYIKKNQYLISNFGNIYSKAINRNMAPAITNGYPCVQLAMEDGSRKTFYIHRLVGMAFVPNYDPENLDEINHKNLYRADNFSENLECVSKEENIQHELMNKNHNTIQETGNKSWGDGYSTYGENNGMAKLKESQVRAMLSAVEKGLSYKDAIISAGSEPTENLRYNLSHIVRGHRWKRISKDYNLPK